MDAKRWSLFALSGIVLLVLIIIFFRSGGGEKIKPSPDIPLTEGAEEPVAHQEAKWITLFFLSEEDSLLHPELRQIQGSASVVREAEETVEELIKGSAKGYLSPLPVDTKLRQLFITREGVAYVDFSKEIMEKHPSGSSAELATVYSIVNSLAYNFKPIKKVFILVEGAEKETLGGHVSLNRPFVPLYSLNAE